MKRLAIVTGAGSGIGQATATEFNLRGWDLVLVGRDSSKLKKTKDLCTNVKSEIHEIPTDITNEDEVKTTAKKIQALNPESISLINNAGIYRSHRVDEGGLNIWLEHFGTNLFGSVMMFQSIFPLMKRDYHHSIVNVSSPLALNPVADVSAYSATKAAMVSWTKSLALELGEKNIRANVICPGFVDTPMHAFHDAPSGKKNQILQKLGSMQPLGRIGTALEIAKSICFLASEEDSSWTTGAVLSVDGGICVK
jgi:NAD(P)-dependent dehydrogenase (short-subunit alcohol dehydrogenase family)